MWVAEHKLLKAKRIVKGIPKDSPFHDRLVREAHLLKNLNSPSIPIIYDVEEDDDHTYIIEQFIEGESLGALLKKRLLSERELFLYIIRISLIIKYLHTLPEKVYYLDIKPDNIIICGEEAYLVDFGSATLDGLAKEQLRSGTIGYSAPELEKGGTLSERTDIYALGMLLKNLAGHSNLSKMTEKKLLRIADRACGNAVWKRISTVDIFIKMLEKIRDGETDRSGKSRSIKAKLQGKRIGIMGLNSGNGTTTIVLAMAEYLAHLGFKKICVVEQNGCNDIGELMKGRGCRWDEATRAFVKGGIHYLTGVPGQQRLRALNGNYDCMVFDLGSDARNALSTMWLCDIRIVAAGAAPWRRKEYSFFNKLKETGQELRNWMIFVNLADNKSLCELGNYGAGLWPFPMEPDPLCPKTETIRFFEKAFKMIP
ncbi:MAG: protein kinase [Lachnospiraceae bacterium]|nr:protein kinase [Lachnospiraceae bacterium]